jgi:hypothetical protein
MPRSGIKVRVTDFMTTQIVLYVYGRPSWEELYLTKNWALSQEMLGESKYAQLDMLYLAYTGLIAP